MNDDADVNLGVSAEEMDKLTARMEERVKDLAADTEKEDDDNIQGKEKDKKKGKKKESMQQIIASFKKKYEKQIWNGNHVRWNRSRRLWNF